MATLSGKPTDGNDTLVATVNPGDSYNFGTLGGDDNVTVQGGGGSASVATGDGNDSVTVNGNVTVGASLGAGDDTFVSRGSGSGTVLGGPGNDTIVGGAGDDWIKGGVGDDIVTGGDGADQFYYPFETTHDGDLISALASVCGHDTITDFQVGQDQLLIGGANMSESDFTRLFSMTQYDKNNDGVADSSLLTLANGDPSFSIKLDGVTASESDFFKSSVRFA